MQYINRKTKYGSPLSKNTSATLFLFGAFRSPLPLQVCIYIYIRHRVGACGGSTESLFTLPCFGFALPWTCLALALPWASLALGLPLACPGILRLLLTFLLGRGPGNSFETNFPLKSDPKMRRPTETQKINFGANWGPP